MKKYSGKHYQIRYTLALLMKLKKYFSPFRPRGDISDSGKEHLKKSLKSSGFWGVPDFTDNRDIWDKHSDNIAREKNREWLKLHANTFAKRWAALSILSWLLAWIVSGFLLLEVPFTLSGILTGTIAIILFKVPRNYKTN